MAFVRVLLRCVLICGVAVPAFAQPQLAEINKKTITLMAGEAAWFSQAKLISDHMAHAEGMRVIPMQGTGCIDTAADVLQLIQVDMALITADCLSYAQQQGLIPNAGEKLAYVTRVKNLPLVLIARKGVPNLTALAGKRIATGAANSAGFASGEIVLGGLGLPFLRVPLSGAAAIAALQKGEADAVLLQGLDALDGSLDGGTFHVLGLTTSQNSGPSQLPALVEAAALKGLLPEGQALETVSTALVLVVFKWPQNSAKAAKIKLFSQVYFKTEAAGEQALELSTEVPGLQRLEAALSALKTLKNDSPEAPTAAQGDGT
jgi:hypothetical protein